MYQQCNGAALWRQGGPWCNGYLCRESCPQTNNVQRNAWHEADAETASGTLEAGTKDTPIDR